jgi:hypothetical protein
MRGCEENTEKKVEISETKNARRRKMTKMIDLIHREV